MYRTITAALVLCSFASAADYAVSAIRGNDTNPGTIAQPFKTLTKAFSVARNGDTVSVFPGRYSPTLGEVFPLSVADGVKVLGTDARSCIIDAEFDPASTANAVTGTVVKIQANCEFARMSIINAPRLPSNPGRYWWSMALHVDDTTGTADNVHIHHCILDNFTRGIVVGYAAGDHSHKNVTIDNCVLSRFYAEALNSWVKNGKASGNRIVNCTVVGHINTTTNKSYARACITMGDFAQFDVRNCVFKDADWAGIETAATGVTSDYNCYHGLSAPVRNGIALGNNDIQVDPQLAALPTVNQTVDAHQTGPGPLFEKGTNIITTGSDMDYQSARLSGASVDIGADEFAGTDTWFVGEPRLGRNFHFAAIGTPSNSVMFALAFSPIPAVSIPGIGGQLRLDLSKSRIILPLPLDARGLNRQLVTIPNTTSLFNLPLYIQCLDVGSVRLSDLDTIAFVQ